VDTKYKEKKKGSERRAKRKLRTEELHCFHSSRVIKGIGMGGTCSNRCGYDKNLKGQIHSRSAVVGMMILKPILRKYYLIVSRFS